MGVRKPISTTSEWTFELIEEYDRAVAEIAAEYGLDTYPNQIEIISSEQMMDAYAASGMPLGYHHWSYGKQFVSIENAYKRGQMGLAYELVINSNPCIAYLMEENTLTMQALVIAHACYGHNSFFKGNYLFRTWTDAESIIDYFLFAKNYIADCEERYGVGAVEKILDSCHALMNYGVDRYKRPSPISAATERSRQKEREVHLQQQVNDLWRTIPKTPEQEAEALSEAFRYPPEPQENLLYFIEKNAPLLEPWQREIVRIVRKVAQYFYPQRQTQVMNEGWATFWHYTLLNDMYDRGLVTEGFILEFLQSHAGVIYQPPFDHPGYSGINPYTLGFTMMRDIRRICEEPTDEDRHWFPDIAGSNWVETLHFAMRNFKDESFILQFLSPRVIRELKLFAIVDDDREAHIEVDAIHDEEGYRAVRESLAELYNLGSREPNIQVYSVDIRGDRSITLHHSRHERKPLDESAQEVLRHLHRLWGFDVHLNSMEDGRIMQAFHCPSNGEA
ncbi:SpoVR family protein [Marinimicrobium sp. ABcell2]|uniref:SpoVR family protein n=1 Tax=Marinimicrobium sp. ABcell2 TaxID=3069751 RepID=UPI0027B237C4|nr:SpoVR family protein [Marinimicrobium sp. ABcell2]MDQ2076295.1 SpoVR family protein [Marinimicrobium sp. ABcell2]